MTQTLTIFPEKTEAIQNLRV